MGVMKDIVKAIVVGSYRVIGERVADIDAVALLEDISLSAHLPFEDLDRDVAPS